MTPTCAVCHVRAATRIVNFGGETGVQFCEVCRARSPADVVDVWRVKNAPQQRNSGQEDQRNMASLTLEEQETHLNMTAADRGVWNIGSDDPIMQRRFEAVGATLVAVRGGWREYTLPANQISLRNKRAPMPEERRAELAMQLRARRTAPEITGAEMANRAYGDNEAGE